MTEHLSFRSTCCQVQRRRSTSASIWLALRLKTTDNNTNNNNNNNARARKTSHDHFRCNYKVSWRAGTTSSSSLASSASPLSRIQLVTIKCVIFVYAFDTFVFPQSSLSGLLSELYGLLYCHHPPPLSPISCTPKPSSDQRAVSCARAPTRREGSAAKIGRAL